MANLKIIITIFLVISCGRLLIAAISPKIDFYITRCFLFFFPNSLMYNIGIAKIAIRWGKTSKKPSEINKAGKEALNYLARGHIIINEMPGAQKYTNKLANCNFKVEFHEFKRK